MKRFGKWLLGFREVWNVSERIYTSLTDQEAGLLLAAVEQWQYEASDGDNSAEVLHERLAAAVDIVLVEKQ